MLYVPVIIAVLAVLFYVSPIGWNATWEVSTDGETQRAAVFTSRTGIEGVEIIAVKKPQIKNPNDVLVKIKYAALNPIDNEVLKKFIHPILCVPSPNTYCGVGLEGAGEVVGIGANVTKFSIGTEVVFQSLGGSVAEYIVLPEINVMSVAKGWSALETSTVGAVTFTSYNALVEVCEINSNTPSLYDGSKDRKVVLVIGGGSSCGQTGITIAKSLNKNHLVIATCGMI
jgi:NADPH:quinone reductase-like Zn-dependent oxidoreductase